MPWMDRLGRVVAWLLPASYGAPQAEVDTLLRAGRGAELFEQDELAVLSGLLAFVDRPARDIMTARTEIVAVPQGAALPEVAMPARPSPRCR